MLYSTILQNVPPGALGHLLVASMMSLPAAIMLACPMLPGKQRHRSCRRDASICYHSTMDALTDGTLNGLEDAGADQSPKSCR